MPSYKSAKFLQCSTFYGNLQLLYAILAFCNRLQLVPTEHKKEGKVNNESGLIYLLPLPRVYVSDATIFHRLIDPLRFITNARNIAYKAYEKVGHCRASFSFEVPNAILSNQVIRSCRHDNN